MLCKYCNFELEDGTKVCPACGKSLEEEETAGEVIAVEAQETAENAETACAETVPESDGMTAEAEETVETDKKPEEAPKKRRIWPVVLWTLAAVLALGVLAVVLLAALGVEIKIPENTIQRKEVYTVSDEKAAKKGDDVVAKVGDEELTNSLLQVYYQMQVREFLNVYGSYLSQLGFDYAQPLSGQICYFDKAMSWEQYFIDLSIENWSFCQALCQDAEKSGFTLDAELEAEFERIPEVLAEEAANGNYESADAMVKELLGPACTVEDYVEYIRMDTTANVYYSKLYGDLEPADEDVEAYFADNEAVLAESGITKDCGLVSSVRHILVCPVAEEGSEETSFTEQQWKDCLTKAEGILQEWKDGDATEESFAALVATYTEDPGSKETGGLYEDIDPTSSYVENFLNWSVDMARQPGDTEIVQTEYGYHIMYFVEGRPYWKEVAKSQLLNELVTNMRTGIESSYPAKVTYKNIAISEIEL